MKKGEKAQRGFISPPPPSLLLCGMRGFLFGGLGFLFGFFGGGFFFGD